MLGVSKEATAEEIKAAHRRLALQNHPDRCPGDASKAARFREVQAAYDVLSDPQKRRDYDSGNWQALPEPARILLEKLGLGFIDGASAGVKAKAAEVGQRLGERGERVAGIFGQTVDLASEVARDALKRWIGK